MNIIWLITLKIRILDQIEKIFFKASDTGIVSVRKALLYTAICAVPSASALKVQTQNLLLFCQPATISTSE